MGFRPKIGRHAATETFNDGSGVIGRGVIYDNHLLIRPVDCECAFDRGTNEVAVVIIRDNDGELHRVLAGTLESKLSRKLSSRAMPAPTKFFVGLNPMVEARTRTETRGVREMIRGSGNMLWACYPDVAGCAIASVLLGRSLARYIAVGPSSR
jgi:hypothetical protein